MYPAQPDKALANAHPCETKEEEPLSHGAKTQCDFLPGERSHVFPGRHTAPAWTTQTPHHAFISTA